MAKVLGDALRAKFPTAPEKDVLKVCISAVVHTVDIIKVEYHANENLFKNSEKIAYVGPINKKVIPHHASFLF